MATSGKVFKRCRDLVGLVIKNARAMPASSPTSGPSTRSASLVASSSVEDLRLTKPAPLVSADVISSFNAEDSQNAKPVVLQSSEVDIDGAEASHAVPSEGVHCIVHASGLPSFLHKPDAQQRQSSPSTASEVPSLDSANEETESSSSGAGSSMPLLPIPSRLSLQVSAEQSATAGDGLNYSGRLLNMASRLSLLTAPEQNPTSGCLTKSDPSKQHGAAKKVKFCEQADWILLEQEEDAAMCESRPVRPDGSSGKLLPRSMMQGSEESICVSVYAQSESTLGFNAQAQLSRGRSIQCYKDADLSSILSPLRKRDRATLPFPACAACSSVSTADELRYAVPIE